uniref:GDSL esterase/lipase n=1 Tax=Aegilops tauschii TaxID=37682 RepID=M8CL76_AEGTA
MGSSNGHCSISLAVLFVFVVTGDANLGSCGCFKRIFSFGDSIIDTGNFAYTIRNRPPSPPSVLPYGETYFHHPTGRGGPRIKTDWGNSSIRKLTKAYKPHNMLYTNALSDPYYLSAQALGLPLLPPSLPEEKTGQFPTGANFAVFGAMALNPNYFKSRYNLSVPFPWSLHDQLATFNKVLTRIAPGDAATKRLLSESLVVFGEIGGNDYNFWFFDSELSKDRNTPLQYMPDIIDRIGAGVQKVINLGAKTILVPGNFPIGCVPAYLSIHKSNTSADYDQFGCLAWFNAFSRRHNQLLKQEIGRLKSRNPSVKIIYADYYGAFMEFIRNPNRNGIDSPLVACCGGNGPYGTGLPCDRNAKVCRDPSRFANWDQVHMTEKAYSVIANGVLNGPYADIPLLHAC